jgi:6-phosphogluconolactonase (cycloisomerase 2 family)
MVKIVRSVFMYMLALSIVPAMARSAQNRDSNGDDASKAVYVMNNDVDRNEVLLFTRTADGSLRQSDRFATGGRGSGGTTDPLSSQGSLTLSRGGEFLFAVNAGSGDVSVFAVSRSRLVLLDTAISGGSEPNAVAQFGELVYVINAAATSNVVGFRFEHGHLRQIPNSTRLLSAGSSGASSLAFSPNGKFLVVTERLTNHLDVFAVLGDGTLAALTVTPSAGPGVFAVTFAPNGAAVVSETGPAGVVNGSAVSSYAVQSGGALSVISASVPTLGAANCWNVVTPDGRFVYVSNSASGSISGFSIATNGALSPVAGTVLATNPAGTANLDLAVSSDGKFLYSLNTGNGTIGIFAIHTDGTLTALGAVTGIDAKAGFNGIAAN